MCLVEFSDAESRRRYDALVAVARTGLVALDFDGTLSPIVDDPAAASIHPDGPRVLTELAGAVRAIALITGRPAQQVVDLGRLEGVADEIDRLGLPARLLVLGQYGNQRWDSTTRRFSSADVPEGLSAFADELPGLLAEADAAGAFLEDKGLAIGVHTRRLADPDAAYARLRPLLADSAGRHGLGLEPGKQVLEVRAPGMDKGRALLRVVEETSAGGLLFAGDDLGDLQAFRAGERLRSEGMPVLLVCSGSTGQTRPTELAGLADVVVDGPAGVLALLADLARASSI